MIKPVAMGISAILLAGPAGGQGQIDSPLLRRLQIPVQYAQVFGQRIAYYEAGPPQAPTVVLVPSLGWDSNAWAQNVPFLSRSFHVIAIDPLGLGRSAKPLVDYTMETWTDGFAEFMRLKGIQRASFLGAVMGAALAVQMALDHPDRVASIVVAASNTGPGPHEGGIRMPGGYPPSLKGTRASLLDWFFDSTLVTDAVERARFVSRLSAGDGYTIQRHLADHRAPYTTAELARIQVPALVVWCREDRVTPLSWGEDFAKAFPQGNLVVLDRCGHYPNMEQPTAFNRAVGGFLDTVGMTTIRQRP
jgi:pimeloyl-ACP methyl ester carboxylesterase